VFGEPGTDNMVKLLDALDESDEPTAFVATTVNV
jgi:hypothetical protein